MLPKILEKCPNLEAILDGRISGYIREWPYIRKELKILLAEMETARKEAASMKIYCHEMEMQLQKVLESSKVE